MITAEAAGRRLVVVGSAVVDIVAFIPQLPEHGGDVVATDSLTSAAGGFNVLAAAARLGMDTALLGRHGEGPNGDHLRAACAGQGIVLPLPISREGDTGFCIGLVDAAGERTYVTVPGVDGNLQASDLERIPLSARDVVYLSGYELSFAHGRLLSDWFAALPPGITTVFDPGPLVAELPHSWLQQVLRRTSWCSLNEREARLLTNHAPQEAGEMLLRLHPQLAGVMVRVGGAGCWLATRSTPSVLIAVPDGPVRPIDTTGAGDCHVGTFIASYSAGKTPHHSVVLANRAAALSVVHRGPATGGTRAELDYLLST